MDTDLVKRHFPFFAGIALCLVAFFISITSVYVLVISHWHGPFRDMWEIHSFIEKIIGKTWSFFDLWESYGFSHRLVIPKLLFIADYQFFNASNHLLIVISTVCQFLICLIFYLAFLRDQTVSKKTAIYFLSLVVSFQFSGTLLFNWLHSFDVQWFLSCLFVTAGFYYLAFFTKPLCVNHEWENGISAVCITLACLNNFSAMAAWPIWAVMIWTNSKKKISTLFQIFPVLVFIAIYASGIHAGGFVYNDLTYSLKLLPYIFAIFPALYLSTPVLDAYSFGFIYVIVAIIAILFFIKFWADYLFKKNDVTSLEIFLASLGLFAYGVAVITAIGRGYDPVNVKALRYQNIVLLFWSSALPFSWLKTRALLSQHKNTIRFLMALFFIGFVAYQPAAWNENIKLGYQVNRAHLALMMGFSSNVPMIAATVSRSMIYVPGYNLEKERALHERARKGIYHGEMADLWLEGITLEKIGRECNSVKWSASPFVGKYTSYINFIVTGMVDGSYRSAFLVNSAGNVVGIAIPEGDASLLSALASITNRPIDLRGFVLPGKTSVALVLWNEDGYAGACKKLLP